VVKAIVRLGALMLAVLLVPHIVNAQTAKSIFAQVSGQVFDSLGQAVPSAAVQLEGSVNTKTLADATGHFVFANVVPGTYTIVVSATGYSTETRSGIVVQNEDLSFSIQLALASKLKEIGHVSTSSGRGAMNVTAAPSYVLTPADMAFQGQTQWGRVLEELPGVSVTGAAGGGPSIIPGSAYNSAIVSIRGAQPYETAMLIDNMPMYGESTAANAGTAVDLASYSPQAFNSYDVIAGPGAQSPSIVGSIGGSLNLHPAGQVTKDHYDFSMSNDAYGGWIANGFAAAHFGKLSATVTYGFNNSPGPVYGASSIVTSPGTLISAINGISFVCTGTCATTANIFPNGNTARGFLNSGQTTGLIGCCTSNVRGEWVNHSESLSLFYQFSNSARAQFFFADNSTPTVQSGTNVPTVFSPTAGFGYAGSLPVNALLQAPTVPYQSVPLVEQSQIYEGKLIFQLGRGQLQVAALTNLSVLAQFQSLPSSLGTMQLFGSGCQASITTVSPCPAGFAPVAFNGTTNTISLYPNVTTVNKYGHNRDLSAVYSTPLSDRARGVVSLVHAYYDFTSQTSLFSQSSNGSGGVTTSSSFTLPQANFATTDEARLGYGFTPNDRTSVEISYYIANARFHVINPASATTAQANLAQVMYMDEEFHYNAPRASFVWRPSSSLSIRASTGGGFAISPLQNVVGGAGAVLGCPALCTQSIPNVNLVPETSWGYDIGFDKRLAQSTVLSFDAYSTNLKGQFYSDVETSGTCPTCSGQPLYVTQFRNLGESRYQGLELDVHRDVSRGVVWSLSGSFMRGYVVSLPPGFYNAANATCNFSTGVGCTNAKIIPGINFNGVFSSAGANVPYAQGFVLYGYRWSPDRFVNVDMHYFGNNNGYFAPAFVVFDASAQLPLTKFVSLQGTFRNITGALDSTVESDGQGYVYPTAFGAPAYTYTIPYNPRTFLLTLHVHD